MWEQGEMKNNWKHCVYSVVLLQPGALYGRIITKKSLFVSNVQLIRQVAFITDQHWINVNPHSKDRVRLVKRVFEHSSTVTPKRDKNISFI